MRSGGGLRCHHHLRSINVAIRASCRFRGCLLLMLLISNPPAIFVNVVHLLLLASLFPHGYYRPWHSSVFPVPFNLIFLFFFFVFPFVSALQIVLVTSSSLGPRESSLLLQMRHGQTSSIEARHSLYIALQQLLQAVRLASYCWDEVLLLLLLLLLMLLLLML